MKLITRDDLASDAARRWKSQYFRDGKWTGLSISSPRTIYESLLALGDSPSPESVNDIINNSTWTEVRCDECKRQVSMAVQLGQEPDYESATATICLLCLKKSVTLVLEEVGK